MKIWTVNLINTAYKAISAAVIHKEAEERHGKNYQTIGYYLKHYSMRKNLTQKQLAVLVNIKQHH